jgi:glycosyltransferase involved in cell wall biosynthesis
VIFVHTQVPAVLLGRRMRRTPTIVSLDATPEQYDLLGEFYSHEPGPAPLERLKREIHRRCFERAAHLVTWSEWARHGLVSAYGVAPTRVTAIAPGVDVGRWRPPDDARSNRPGPVRILFVGNDLGRKGGDLLIDAARHLRQDARIPEFAIHLVTSAEVDPEPGVIVHRGLSANSPELITQYRDADIFCLPTRGDCLPMVLAEAAATGLPLISTDVGAIHEVVVPGRTGELIQSGSLDALIAALRALIEDPQLRLRYGAAARRLAEQRHDARANAARVVDVMLACLPALQTSSRRRPPTE